MQPPRRACSRHCFLKASVSERGAPDNWPDVVNTQQQSGQQGAFRSLPTREGARGNSIEHRLKEGRSFLVFSPPWVVALDGIQGRGREWMSFLSGRNLADNAFHSSSTIRSM